MSRRLVLSALIALSATACTSAVAGNPVAGPAAPSPSSDGPTVECAYAESDAPPPKRVDLPSGDARGGGTVRFTVRTDLGGLVFEFDTTSAPCSVHSFRSLVDQGFYDGTSCHRLTVSDLFVLQCGDATGTGQGGPGYLFDDPEAVPGEYPRGVVAMANQTRPGTNGSQFFIVHRDSPIDPDYPILGRVVEGMDVVDRVVAGGVAPGTGFGADDGRPVLPFRLTSVEED